MKCKRGPSKQRGGQASVYLHGLRHGPCSPHPTLPFPSSLPPHPVVPASIMGLPVARHIRFTCRRASMLSKAFRTIENLGGRGRKRGMESENGSQRTRFGVSLISQTAVIALFGRISDGCVYDLRHVWRQLTPMGREMQSNASSPRLEKIRHLDTFELYHGRCRCRKRIHSTTLPSLFPSSYHPPLLPPSLPPFSSTCWK